MNTIKTAALVADPASDSPYYKKRKYFQFSFLAILFLANIIACANEPEAANTDDKVLMAIFAHPDDETLVGPILNQYANKGVEVILVTVTDGRLGFTGHTDYEDEDELAAVRQEELRCAADYLGAELIHLDYEDQLGISEGHNNLIAQSRGILRDLHRIIEERKPDAIITFGPDGFSNHMDHRLTGVSVTQVVLSREWDKTPSLFYVGVPVSVLDDDEWMYMGVDDRYLTIQIPFTDEELEAAERAALCHESQFTPEFVADWIESMQEWGKIIYFRPFEAPAKEANDLFDYMER